MTGRVALTTAYGGEHGWIDGHLVFPNAVPAFETYTFSGNKKVKGVLSEAFRTCRIDVPDVAGSLFWQQEFPRICADGVVIHECTGPGPSAISGPGIRVPPAHGRPAEPCRARLVATVRRQHRRRGGRLDQRFRGTETCDVVQYMWNYIWLLRIAGEGQWGDRVERAFSNAAPATVRGTQDPRLIISRPTASAACPGRPGYRGKGR